MDKGAGVRQGRFSDAVGQEKILEQADTIMYQAKGAGRNQIRICESRLAALNA